jgi:hypothetical protein
MRLCSSSTSIIEDCDSSTHLSILTKRSIIRQTQHKSLNTLRKYIRDRVLFRDNPAAGSPAAPGAQLPRLGRRGEYYDRASVSLGGHNRVGWARMNAGSVARLIKRAASLDPATYAGHSLRAGFATQAFLNGAAEVSIMRQTRHKSLNTLRKYIRDRSLFRDNPAAKLGLYFSMAKAPSATRTTSSRLDHLRNARPDFFFRRTVADSK